MSAKLRNSLTTLISALALITNLILSIIVIGWRPKLSIVDGDIIWTQNISGWVRSDQSIEDVVFLRDDVYITYSARQIFITVNNVKHVLAGTGDKCMSDCGDGGGLHSASFNKISSIALMGSDLYVADRYASRVRVIRGVSWPCEGCIIETAFGTGEECPAGSLCGDGGLGIFARISQPVKLLAVDSILLISDFTASKVRMLYQGNASTFLTQDSFEGDELFRPTGMVHHTSSNVLYLSDYGSGNVLSMQMLGDGKCGGERIKNGYVHSADLWSLGEVHCDKDFEPSRYHVCIPGVFGKFDSYINRAVVSSDVTRWHERSFICEEDVVERCVEWCLVECAQGRYCNAVQAEHDFAENWVCKFLWNVTFETRLVYKDWSSVFIYHGNATSLPYASWRPQDHTNIFAPPAIENYPVTKPTLPPPKCVQASPPKLISSSILNNSQNIYYGEEFNLKLHFDEHVTIPRDGNNIQNPEFKLIEMESNDIVHTWSVINLYSGVQENVLSLTVPMLTPSSTYTLSTTKLICDYYEQCMDTFEFVFSTAEKLEVIEIQQLDGMGVKMVFNLDVYVIPNSFLNLVDESGNVCGEFYLDDYVFVSVYENHLFFALHDLLSNCIGNITASGGPGIFSTVQPRVLFPEQSAAWFHIPRAIPILPPALPPIIKIVPKLVRQYPFQNMELVVERDVTITLEFNRPIVLSTDGGIPKLQCVCGNFTEEVWMTGVKLVQPNAIAIPIKVKQDCAYSAIFDQGTFLDTEAFGPSDVITLIFTTKSPDVVRQLPFKLVEYSQHEMIIGVSYDQDCQIECYISRSEFKFGNVTTYERSVKSSVEAMEVTQVRFDGLESDTKYYFLCTGVGQTYSDSFYQSKMFGSVKTKPHSGMSGLKHLFFSTRLLSASQSTNTICTPSFSNTIFYYSCYYEQNQESLLFNPELSDSSNTHLKVSNDDYEEVQCCPLRVNAKPSKLRLEIYGDSGENSSYVIDIKPRDVLPVYISHLFTQEDFESLNQRDRFLMTVTSNDRVMRNLELYFGPYLQGFRLVDRYESEFIYEGFAHGYGIGLDVNLKSEKEFQKNIFLLWYNGEVVNNLATIKNVSFIQPHLKSIHPSTITASTESITIFLTSNLTTSDFTKIWLQPKHQSKCSASDIVNRMSNSIRRDDIHNLCGGADLNLCKESVRVNGGEWKCVLDYRAIPEKVFVSDLELSFQIYNTMTNSFHVQLEPPVLPANQNINISSSGVTAIDISGSGIFVGHEGMKIYLLDYLGERFDFCGDMVFLMDKISCKLPRVDQFHLARFPSSQFSFPHPASQPKLIAGVGNLFSIPTPVNINVEEDPNFLSMNSISPQVIHDGCCQELTLHGRFGEIANGKPLVYLHDEEKTVFVRCNVTNHQTDVLKCDLETIHQPLNYNISIGLGPATTSYYITTTHYQCPVGTKRHSNLSLRQCTPCTPGTYQDTPNHHQNCKPCPAHTFSTQNASVFCTPCPMGMMTKLNSTRSNFEDCICGKGRYSPDNVSCEKCVDGLDCGYFGSGEALPGYWKVSENKVYRCDEDLCLVGNQCEYGYDENSLGCMACDADAGFYRPPLSKYCQHCGDLIALQFIVYLLGLVFIVFIFGKKIPVRENVVIVSRRFAKYFDDGNYVTSIRAALTFCQLVYFTSLARNTDSFDLSRGLLLILSICAGDLSAILPSACLNYDIFGGGYVMTWILSGIFPVVMVTLVLVSFCLVQKFIRKRRCDILRVVGFFVWWYILPIIWGLSTPFFCTEKGGMNFLTDNPSVLCNYREHKENVDVGVVLLSIFCGVVVLFFGMVALSERRRAFGSVSEFWGGKHEILVTFGKVVGLLLMRSGEWEGGLFMLAVLVCCAFMINLDKSYLVCFLLSLFYASLIQSPGFALMIILAGVFYFIPSVIIKYFASTAPPQECIPLPQVAWEEKTPASPNSTTNETPFQELTRSDQYFRTPYTQFFKNQ